jgi:hypothetical protein
LGLCGVAYATPKQQWSKWQQQQTRLKTAGNAHCVLPTGRHSHTSAGGPTVTSVGGASRWRALALARRAVEAIGGSTDTANVSPQTHVARVKLKWVSSV